MLKVASHVQRGFEVQAKKAYIQSTEMNVRRSERFMPGETLLRWKSFLSTLLHEPKTFPSLSTKCVWYITTETFMFIKGDNVDG